MNFNRDSIIDINNLTIEDLKEEYLKLFDKYQHLVQERDTDNQTIYELRRHLKTAAATEAYLSQELEQFSSLESVSIKQVKQKLNHEIEELKKRCANSEAECAQLEQNLVDLRSECSQLNCKIDSLQKTAADPSVVNNTTQVERDYKLENENFVLLGKIDEYQADINKYMMGIAEREKHIDILKDQVVCLEENLKSKREELEEKSSLLESAQEQIIEMNAQIAYLNSAPENNDRKGNSLFAEVDDQRQVMKQILSAQKKNYMKMKQIYNEREFEIRRLKRENVAMHTELQICTSLFINADKVYKDKLNKRIMYLIKQNMDLQRELSSTHEKLIAVANDKGINWLDSILDFCKQETEELKIQLRSCLIEKGILDEQFRKCQQDMAKWRFEALKTRCIIIDRESLLEENKTKFKTFTPYDFKITSSYIEQATPNIGIPTYSSNANEITEESASKSFNDSPSSSENFAIMCKPIQSLLETNDKSYINKTNTEETLKSSSILKNRSTSTDENCSDFDITLLPGEQAPIRNQLNADLKTFDDGIQLSPCRNQDFLLNTVKENIPIAEESDKNINEPKNKNIESTHKSFQLIKRNSEEYTNKKHLPLSPLKGSNASLKCDLDTDKVQSNSIKRQELFNIDHLKTEFIKNDVENELVDKSFAKQKRTKSNIIIRKIIFDPKKEQK